MELKDKVAVITGGASGPGKATVLRFVAAGPKVCEALGKMVLYPRLPIRAGNEPG